MAIAKVLKTQIIIPKEEVGQLVKEIEKEGLIHIEDIHEGLEEEMLQWENKLEVDTSSVDQVLLNVKWILDLFKTFNPVERGLLEEFFGSAPYIEEQKFKEMIESFDLQGYIKELKAKHEKYESILSRLDENEELVETLTPWQEMKDHLSLFEESSYTTTFPVSCNALQLMHTHRDIEKDGISDSVTWVEVTRKKKEILGYFIVLNEKKNILESIIKGYGLKNVSFPLINNTALDAIREAKSEIEKLKKQKAEMESFFAGEAEKYRGFVQAYSDEFLNRKKNLTVTSRMFHSNTVSVVQGWVRESNREVFEKSLKKYKNAVLRFTRPTKDDNPPIILENPKILKPYQILIEMFGMPRYFGIDPTPLVALAMTFFYAMVLADVGYGTLQVLISILLKRKFKPDQGTRLFLDLFLEMGIVSIVFGFLTWSFFGTSIGYQYGGRKILGILPLFSPTKDIMVIIGISIFVGVIFQLISIFAGFVNALKNGELQAAIFDYLMWFLLLFSIIGWIATQFTSAIPSPIVNIILLILAVSALAIVAFTGRESKNIGGRLMMGVISLYGIVGYYGIVSFFSDVLSYMRLAVLNLTTGFIALVGNMMGQLLISKGNIIITIVSLAIGATIIILFHVLNLLLSMLSAFVHSLRLNYLESFNRYYPSGGKQFIPFKREAQYYRFEK